MYPSLFIFVLQCKSLLISTSPGEMRWKSRDLRAQVLCWECLHCLRATLSGEAWLGALRLVTRVEAVAVPPPTPPPQTGQGRGRQLPPAPARAGARPAAGAPRSGIPPYPPASAEPKPTLLTSPPSRRGVTRTEPARPWPRPPTLPPPRSTLRHTHAPLPRGVRSRRSAASM